MEKPIKIKTVKGWASHCSHYGITRAYGEKQKAVAFVKMQNDEYNGTCSHKVIPVLITPIIKKK